jgi:hypothetical protein
MLKRNPVIRLFVILGIVIGILMVLPLKIPFSVKSHAKLFHGKEWVVRKDESGRISAVLLDRINGLTENYRLHQFDRQDAIQFVLHSSVVPGNFINSGDTVGSIYSTQLNREYISLVGDLAVTRASIDLYLAGEKETIIEEARNRLAYAEQQLKGHAILLDRQRELHDRDLISDEELDIAIQQKRLYEINIHVAESQLQTALTGAKDEQIGYLNAKIHALEEQIRSLEQSIRDYTYIAPIDGIVYHTFSQDTLAIIGDPETYVAVVPVPLHYRPYIIDGQQVKLRIPGNNIATCYGTIHSVGNIAHLMNGGQYFIISAVIDNNDEGYVPGIMASASIQTEPVTIREYLLRYTRPIFN